MNNTIGSVMLFSGSATVVYLTLVAISCVGTHADGSNCLVSNCVNVFHPLIALWVFASWMVVFGFILLVSSEV